MRARPILGLWAMLALGCPGRKGPSSDTFFGDDTGVMEGTSVQALCDAVFALCEDDWGWDDPSACYSGWLGEGEAWACADPQRYLSCAGPCPEADDCDAFGACETSCWDQHCVEG